LALSHLSAVSRFDFDCAVLSFGETFEAKQRETVDAPAPKRTGDPTIPVPKYKDAQLRAFLGLPPGDGDGDEAALLAAPPSDGDLALVDDILRGRADWLFQPSPD
jgi:hypothetical protein